jgi:RNA polymerase sigma-70 factor (ECF subfamily)
MPFVFSEIGNDKQPVWEIGVSVAVSLHTGNARQPYGEAPIDLIERARTDSDAFGELYDLYFDRVFRFCAARIREMHQIEDITQDTFVRALNALTCPKGRPGRFEQQNKPFSVWLLRIAANLICDHWRRPSTTKDSTLNDMMPGSSRDTLLDNMRGQEPMPEKLVEDWERAAQIRACVARLTPRQQEVLRLRFWGDQDWASIARTLDLSEGAVKKLRERALHDLARQLADDRRISAYVAEPARRTQLLDTSHDA